MSAEHWPDVAGRLIEDETGRHHELPVRVYFEDTDAGGVVYHASYVRFCERGRTDFLRHLGVDARRMITGEAVSEPAVFVVRRMSLDFIRPGRMDDLLLVTTRVKDLGGASVTLTQEISRDGSRIFAAEVVVVLVSVAGKPMRLTDAIRRGFTGRQG
ncbi:MAG: tol-pal system-associated acyl-CoA thioesterase [Hyphomicrobiaceae bacterium]|nr:tol-pal system-associated acyl-CoA thioesterase [Hyphomicrobiaceae bacterium]